MEGLYNVTGVRVSNFAPRDHTNAHFVSVGVARSRASGAKTMPFFSCDDVRLGPAQWGGARLASMAGTGVRRRWTGGMSLVRKTLVHDRRSPNAVG